MSEPVFFVPKAVLTLEEVIALTQAVCPNTAEKSRIFRTVAALELAGPLTITIFEGHEGLDVLARTQAGACLVDLKYAASVPQTTVALVSEAPGRAFERIVAAFFPDAARPASMFATRGINPAAFVHFEARLEADVILDPGVVIGPRAEIGSGTVIGANSVIGPEVRIGRDCAIGAHVTIAHALIGNFVTIAPGVRIGQDAPCVASRGTSRVDPSSAPDDRVMVPGLGRVIIQDNVAIGANSTIDRGGLRDTIIGEGTRIGTLVSIARDRTIARDSRLTG